MREFSKTPMNSGKAVWVMPVARWIGGFCVSWVVMGGLAAGSVSAQPVEPVNQPAEVNEPFNEPLEEDLYQPQGVPQPMQDAIAPLNGLTHSSLFNGVEEIPEEILRTEIITGARSPLTGKPMSAADYAQLQAQLAGPAGDPLVNQELRYLVFLLQLRQGLQPIIPFF